MSAYLHMIPETEVSYKERGDGAYQALASGVVPSSFRGLPVYESHALDVDFNGAPISLLERDRMCGEWWVIHPDQEIAIFSAEHDRFIKITYAEAAAADILKDMQGEKKTLAERLENAKTKAAAGLEGQEATNARDAVKALPIIIFRPFQTWTMASCILCRAGSELGNTFRKLHALHCLPCSHCVLTIASFSCKTLQKKIQTDTTICSFRTTPSARLWSGTTRFTAVPWSRTTRW